MAAAPTPYLQPGDKLIASGERSWVTGKAPERRRDVLLDPPLELDSSQNKQVRLRDAFRRRTAPTRAAHRPHAPRSPPARASRPARRPARSSTRSSSSAPT